MQKLNKNEMNQLYEERLREYDIIKIANLRRPEVQKWIIKRLTLYQYYKKQIITREDNLKELRFKKYNNDLDNDALNKLCNEIKDLEKDLRKYKSIYNNKLEKIKVEQKFKFIPTFIEINLDNTFILKRDILFYRYLANKKYN